MPEHFVSSWTTTYDDQNVQQVSQGRFKQRKGTAQTAFCLDKDGEPCKAFRMGRYLVWGAMGSGRPASLPRINRYRYTVLFGEV